MKVLVIPKIIKTNIIYMLFGKRPKYKVIRLILIKFGNKDIYDY